MKKEMQFAAAIAAMAVACVASAAFGQDGELTFLLDRWAGKPAKLELLHMPGGTVDESVCWGHLELKSNNGGF